MNSYPAELVVQLAPVMFVAGLDTAVATQRRPMSAQTDASTSSTSASSTSRANPAPAKQDRDPFAVLAARLRDALAAQRRPAVWAPEAARKSKTFQVVFVDKNVQFPPRKLPPPVETTYQHHNLQARSPLSPLHVSSPLYPDGLIAPLWVRKHTALVPSVFVLFMRLYEYPPAPDTSDSEIVKKYKEERELREKEEDAELAREIAHRKESTNERSIKLTVVLIASRRMLDDPSLDSRLSNLRRRATLDARAALFVLSPVSQAELAEFVRSLQTALIDPALEYYTGHSKRVRRKRNRVQQSSSSHGAASGGHSAPLRPEGWTVRYEYKMACFAEFRGEDEVALKHFQDSYNTLLGLFANTSGGLPARTKRWAEAKVLADCISIKICKLYLYNAEPALALAQLNIHLRRFSELSSRVWGIGDSTYEFWAWVGRQYRAFAELLEQGTLSTPPLVIPSAIPTSASAAPPPAPIGALGIGITSGSVNPSTHLMHPGFYYAAAAMCAERRRLRFLETLNSEERMGDDSAAYGGQGPGFSTEKKADHLGSILELYTKSYELFKKYGPSSEAPGSPLLSLSGPVGQESSTVSQGQTVTSVKSNIVQSNVSLGPGLGRFPLWVAYRIALTYHVSGRHDLANRFFERIVNTYTLRREAWGALLRPLLSTWYACSQQLGNVDLSVRLAVQMILYGNSSLSGPGFDGDVLDGNVMTSQLDEDEGGDIVEDFKVLLQTTVPTKPGEPIIIDATDIDPLLDVSSTIFWESEAPIDTPVAFQVAISVPKSRMLSSGSLLITLPVQSIKLILTCENDQPVDGDDPAEDQQLSLLVEHDETIKSGKRRTNVGELSYTGSDEAIELRAKSNLRWKSSDDEIVLCGSFTSSVPTEVKFSKCVLTLAEGGWIVDIPFQLDLASQKTFDSPRWMLSDNPPKHVVIRRRNPYELSIKRSPHRIQVSFIHDAPAYVDEQYPIIINVTNSDDRELEVIIDVLLQPSEDDSANEIKLGSEESSGLIKGVSLGLLRPGVTAQKVLHLTSMGGSQSGGDRMLDISVQSRQARTDDKDGLDSNADDMNENLQTLVIPVVRPFSALQDVSYSRRTAGDSQSLPGLGDLESFDNDFWDDSFGGEASVKTILECTGTSGTGGVVLLDMQLRVASDTHVKLLNSSIDAEDFPAELWPGDEFAAMCNFSIAPPEDFFTDRDAVIPAPGYYEITWRRRSHTDSDPPSISRVAIQPLKPPADGLIGLLRIAPIARLHDPLPLEIVVRNLHPTRTACPYVQLDLDSSDAFVVSGLRIGKLPNLLPGTETRITWQLFPLECGEAVGLPRIRITDRRKSSDEQATAPTDSGTQPDEGGEPIKIVDARWDSRWSDGTYSLDAHQGVQDGKSGEKFAIVVTPS